MPLAAEYTWAESETTIQLQVPLRGRSKSTVDVFGERSCMILSVLFRNPNVDIFSEDTHGIRDQPLETTTNCSCRGDEDALGGWCG